MISILLCALLPVLANAGMKLEQVPDWQCTLLPSSTYRVFPNLPNVGTVIISTNQSIVHARLPNTALPLFELQIPTGPYALQDVSLGDFDHDGSPELAMALRRTDLPSAGIDSLGLEIHLFHLPVPSTIDTLYFAVPLTSPAGYGLELQRDWGSIGLNAVDFTHDGFPDLRMWAEFRTTTTDYIDMLYYYYSQEMYSRVWSRTPDSMISAISSDCKSTQVTYDGQVLGQFNSSWSQSGNGSCCVPKGGGTIGTRLYNSASHTVNYPSLGALEDCDDPCQGHCTSRTSNILLCNGRPNPSSPLLQLLVNRWVCNDCRCLNEIQLITVDSTGETVLLWSKSPDDYSGLQSYFWSAAFPGYLLALGSDKKAHLIDGVTGNLQTESAETYDGTVLGWYDVFGTGEQYLLVRQDNNAVLYHVDITTAVGESDETNLPTRFTLGMPYPNPFNPSVSFSVRLEAKTEVTIDVFDILGRRVETLFDGTLSAGTTNFSWNAQGRASGLYFIHAKTSAGQTEVRKAILLK